MHAEWWNRVFSCISRSLSQIFRRNRVSRPHASINSGCIGMIKPQRTQRRQRKGREMNNSDANGFDISPDRLTFRVGRFLFIVTKIYSWHLSIYEVMIQLVSAQKKYSLKGRSFLAGARSRPTTVHLPAPKRPYVPTWEQLANQKRSSGIFRWIPTTCLKCCKQDFT